MPSLSTRGDGGRDVERAPDRISLRWYPGEVALFYEYLKQFILISIHLFGGKRRFCICCFPNQVIRENCPTCRWRGTRQVDTVAITDAITYSIVKTGAFIAKKENFNARSSASRSEAQANWGFQPAGVAAVVPVPALSSNCRAHPPGARSPHVSEIIAHQHHTPGEAYRPDPYTQSINFNLYSAAARIERKLSSRLPEQPAGAKAESF